MRRTISIPDGLGPAVKTRVAAATYPKLYRLRARMPCYNPRRRVKSFNRRAEERGLGDLRRFYWYHTVDLGGGLLTPGTLDYRASLGDFHFPGDMERMTVLDVGSGTASSRSSSRNAVLMWFRWSAVPRRGKQVSV